jgi:hypothetical protein
MSKLSACKRKQQEDQRVAALEAENWNLRHPIGTTVILHTDSRGDVLTNTRSAAYVCESGYAVCFFEGISGYYLINRATPFSEQEMRPPMRFNFSCFALCAMTIEVDEDIDLDEVSAELLSFHTSVLDAMKEQTHVTELQRAAHKLSYSGPGWLPRWRVPDFKEPQYQVVPIQQMRFDNLSDAQGMIEQAAVLQQKGVGV